MAGKGKKNYPMMDNEMMGNKKPTMKVSVAITKTNPKKK